MKTIIDTVTDKKALLEVELATLEYKLGSFIIRYLSTIAIISVVMICAFIFFPFLTIEWVIVPICYLVYSFSKHALKIQRKIEAVQKQLKELESSQDNSDNIEG